ESFNRRAAARAVVREQATGDLLTGDPKAQCRAPRRPVRRAASAGGEDAVPRDLALWEVVGRLLGGGDAAVATTLGQGRRTEPGDAALLDREAHCAGGIAVRACRGTLRGLDPLGA